MRVDFYVLAEETPWGMACKLLEKAYLLGHSVYVHCATLAHAQLLDELLWTFKDTSFIPHNLKGEGPVPPPPIQLGYGIQANHCRDILLNLDQEVPAFFTQFQRVMEIVVNLESAKAQSRSHYTRYKANRCEIQTHHLTATS